MPAKAKGSGGKDGGGGGEMKLDDFRSLYEACRNDPSLLTKKNGPWATLDEKAQAGSPEEQHLAKLCRARLALEQGPENWVAGWQQYKESLDGMIKEKPFSLTASCLAVAWLDHMAKSGDAEAQSLARSGWQACLLMKAKEEDCRDPADEAVVPPKCHSLPFDDLSKSKTKADRIKQLRDHGKAVAGALLKVVNDAVASTVAGSKAQPAAAAKAKGAEKAAAAAGAAAQPSAEEVAKREAEKQELKRFGDVIQGREEKLLAVEAQREELLKKLDQHLAEGKDRRQAMCDLMKGSLPEFEEFVRTKLDEYLSLYGTAAEAKAAWARDFRTQLDRWRSGGQWMALRPAKLAKLLQTSTLGGAAEANGSAKESAKESSGEGKGGKGKGGKGKGGGGGGGKGQDVAADAAGAEGDKGATFGTVKEFVSWLLDALKEEGSSVVSHLTTLAWLPNQPMFPGHNEQQFLSGVQGAAVHPEKALLLQLGAGADDAPGSAVAETLLKVRSGAGLLRPGKELEETNRVYGPSASARVKFASQLGELSELARHDVINNMAEQSVVVAGVSVPPAGGWQVAPLCDAFASAEEGVDKVLQRLGDPLSLIKGYAAVLQQRGVLPLSGRAPSAPPTASSKGGKGAKEAVAPPTAAAGAGAAAGLDATGLRLARLADYMASAGGELMQADALTAVLCVVKTNKPEHREVVRRLFGEMPVQMRDAEERDRERRKKITEAAAKGEPLPEDEDYSDPAFGPYLEFEQRELPAAERAEAEEGWRRDIVDALRVLEAGGVDLGYRLSATLRLHLSSACKKPLDQVPQPLTAASLDKSGLLRMLSTPQLLPLRLFVLSVLGSRVTGTAPHLEERLAEHQRLAREELFALELLPKEKDKVRLSEAGYAALSRRAWERKQRRLLRLRVAHAIRKAIDAHPTAAGCGSVSNIAGGGSAAAGSGGGKGKKGKGGGGGAGGGGGDELDTTYLRLPPLPDGVQPLPLDPGSEDERARLLDFYPMEQYSEWALREALVYPDDILCTREAEELLDMVLEGTAVPPPPGTADAEQCLVEELLAPGGPDLGLTGAPEDPPMFSLREVAVDAARAALMDSLRQLAAKDWREQAARVMKLWVYLLQEIKDEGLRQKVVDAARSRLSPQACLLLDKAEAAAAECSDPRLDKPLPLAQAAAELARARQEVTGDAYLLNARMLRVATVAYAARLNEVTSVKDRLNQVLEDLNKKESAGSAAAAKAGGKGGKGKNKTDAKAELEKRRKDELSTELHTASTEVDFVDKMVRGAHLQAENLTAYRTTAIGAGPGSGVRGGSPEAVDPSDATALADRLVGALQALQLYGLHLAVVDMSVEALQVQARSTLHYALCADPALEIGVAGLGLGQRWLMHQLHNEVSAMQEKLFIREEEEKAKAKAEKAAEEERKKREKAAAAAAKKQAAVGAKAAEEEAAAEDEEEAERQREREEEERREAEKRAKEEREREEREKAKAQSAYSDFHFRIDPDDDSIWTKDEDKEREAKEKETAAAAAKEREREAKGGKGGGAMAARLAAERDRGDKVPPGPGGKEAEARGAPAGPSGRRDAGPGPAAAAAGKGPAASAAATAAIAGGKPGAPPPGGKPGPAVAAAPPGKGGKDAGGKGGPQGQGQGPPPAGGKGGPGGKDAGGKGGAAAPPAQGGKGAPPAAGGKPGQPAAGGKPGPAAAAAKAPAPAPAAKSNFVPGFEPEETGSKGAKPRRARKAPGEAAAAAAGGADDAADGAVDLTGGEGMDLSEVPAAPEPALDAPPLPPVEDYPLQVPYPLEPPPEWSVIEGYVFPVVVDVEAEVRAAASAYNVEPNSDGAVAFRLHFICSMAVHNYKDYGQRGKLPPFPVEAYRDPSLAPPNAPRHTPLPYATPAAVPGMPPPPFGVPGGPLVMPPPGIPGVGPPPPAAFAGMPGMPWMARPGMPVMPPPPGMMPPPGMPPYGQPSPYGGPVQPLVQMPTAAAPPQAMEEDETDDLLALMGVGGGSAAAPATPAPAPFQPQHVPFQPPYGALAPPQYVAHQPQQQPEDSMVPSWGDEPAAPAGQQRAPGPMSWAQKMRAGAPAAPGAARTSLDPGRPGHAHVEEDDDGEADLQRALLESAQAAPDVAFPPLSAAGAAAGAAAAKAAAAATGARRAPPAAASAVEAPGVAGTGLVNRVGEYNCFLNVIIQCLWHCASFRAQIHTLNPDDYTAEHPIVAALLRLFQALDQADSGGAAGAASQRHVVDPSDLREALDAVGIRAGEMNDPSEVLCAVFEALNEAPGLSAQEATKGQAAKEMAIQQLSVVDRTFGLLLSEEVRCLQDKCHKTTHVVPSHIEYYMIISATALRDMPMLMEMDDPSMATIMHELETQHIKKCDTDPPFHGCNTPTKVTRTLHNVPDVFMLLLAWEQNVSSEEIAGTLEHLDTLFNPKEVFDGGNCPVQLPSYALHGMFCYYGQHYHAFINRGPTQPCEAQEWVMFDDATVSAIGPWAAVSDKCVRGRIQPSVLFYQKLGAAGQRR
ncbi:hypothetical protein HYH03_001622 [Edaphochlamys debaryana]|uniref:USP domain-containing protein n=1 Tax=Edaphochlamys debaryana TaxID=47281 RepID=A0A836C548_9CHLO|nr:hypothetical protein HYH03_001622 [Edaphochlamys debaryana]|eukprot:KAG2500861.1 hypothetical protein HYH03_001622 [Edaphochlamys debaryana]